MFDYFVASAKLLQLFLVIFLCSVFSPIEVFFLARPPPLRLLMRSLPAVWLLLVPMPSVARPSLLLWMWLLWPLPLSPPVWPLLVPMPSVARPPLGSMSSIMRVNLCLLMDGSGFANVG